MFAGNMKILTLSIASPTAAQAGGGSQPITKELNTNGNGGNIITRVGMGTSSSNHKPSKREQKHNGKIKFVHVTGGKMQQQITQQHQQPQKYHNKNNNSNSNNNGSKLKNQHYNNSSNNNSTSSLNRKKFYQQQQHHQQQHKHYMQQQYSTAIQTTTNSSQSTSIGITNNNNNSHFVKNQNYSNTDLNTQQQLKQLNITNIGKKSANHSTNLIETCKFLVQQSNCDKLSPSSCSSASASSTTSSVTTTRGNFLHQDQRPHTACYDNNCKSSLSLNSKSFPSDHPIQETAASETDCNNYLEASTILPTNLKTGASLNSKPINTSSSLKEFVTNATTVDVSKTEASQNFTRTGSGSASSATITSSTSNTPTFYSASKTNSGWKTLNTGSGSAVVEQGENCNLTLSGETTQSSKLSKEEQQHASNKELTNIASKTFSKNSNCNEEKYSTILTSKVSIAQRTQISAPEKMTTSLTASSDSTSMKTSVPNNTGTSSSSKSCSISTKEKQDTLEKFNDSKQVLKTLSNNGNVNSGINRTATNSSSSKSPVTSSQNSYTLDFLHSVGVKMTGISSGIKGLTANEYVNQSTVHSPAHSSCSNHRQTRHTYVGSSTNNGNSGNHQQHYHHPQPSQLTIASFLNKDLLGVDTKDNNNNGRASSSSSNSRNFNNYNDQHQHQHYTQPAAAANSRYHHNYYTTSYHHQSTVLNHSSYVGGGGGYRGELARLVTSGSGGQRNSGYANYHNSGGEGGISKNNAISQQQHPRHLKNVGNFKNSLSNSQTNKKTTYASSTTSSCSSSSSKSISSNSSNISSRQLQIAAKQDSNFQTLPSKILGGINQRINHRGHHSQLGYYHGNHHHPHHHQLLMMNSPNVVLHQNRPNLTYVNTNSCISGATSTGCSPTTQSLPSTPASATNCQSPNSIDNNISDVSMLINLNANHLQYNRYQHTQHLPAQQQFHQFQQQQNNFLNKSLLSPSLNMASSSASPTSALNTGDIQTSLRLSPHPTQCATSCSQSNEATTTATAVAVSSPSPLLAGSDYDSNNALHVSGAQNKYLSLKSLNPNISSSPSASSACNISVNVQQNYSQSASAVTAATCEPKTPLHSPLDCNYNGSTTQHFSNIQITQQPQLSQFYDNNGAVISLLNFSTKSQTQNSYGDEDYLQQHQFFVNTTTNQRAPPDHLNIASALTAATNRSNNNINYWSPTYHNNQFIYHPTSSAQVALLKTTTTSSSSSCGSSSASISPRLPHDDIQQQQLHTNCGLTRNSLTPSPFTSASNEQFNSVAIGNSSSADSGILVSGSSCSSSSSSASSCSSNETANILNSVNGGQTCKRDSLPLLAQQRQCLISQPTYQSSSSSASSLSSSSAATLTSAIRAQSLGGGECVINANDGRNNQYALQPQSSMISSVGSGGIIRGVEQLPPTSPQNLYSHHQQQQTLPPLPLPPHNVLYNNPQTHHMRALTSSSINSSVNDFYTHTPPDRFLARAHLVEVKEAPPTLLDNSKWDPLSESIWKKFVHSQQTEETFIQKMHLWRCMYLFIKNSYPRYGLYLVGSTISGFGSDSSDVDMCLVSRISSGLDPRVEALCNLTALRDCLLKSGEFDNFNLIEAKVPILRFCDRTHQLEVDLNYNNCVGIKNTHLLYCYSQLDWRLRPLVLVAKLWAQHHNINNAKNMTISSYSLVLMVIHFLQYAVNPPVLPCLHEIYPDKFPLLRSNDFGYVDMNESIGAYDSKNNQTIGELFLLFLEYYSFFDYTHFAISVRTGGLLPINVCRMAKSIKNDVHQWKELCIEEPFDLTNTARSVYDYETFERVKAVFVASWRILQETLDLNSVFTDVMLSSPCSIESSTIIQNVNLTTTTTSAFNKIESNIDATNSKINHEQHVKSCNVSTTAGENYEENKLSIAHDESVMDVDGNVTDEDDNNVTVTGSSLIATEKFPKRNDLNCGLTPRPINIFSEKDYPYSLAYIESGAQDINNNKTATPIIS